MNDMLYIIDKENFSGCIDARMPDGVRTKYTKLTLNQYRELKKNPNLIAVTVEEFELMRDKYIQSLITPLAEISESEYYETFKERKFNAGGIDKGFACFFFGELNTFGIYDCLCELNDKYYTGKKKNTITRTQIEEEVKFLNQKDRPRKKVIVTEYNLASECIELYGYLDKFAIRDVMELFDGDTCKMRIGGYDYYYIKIDYDGVVIVVYLDVQYEIERKELETILFLFFSDGFTLHFEKKYSQWSEYMEGCIAFKEWGQSTFAIWQYTGELPKPKK